MHILPKKLSVKHAMCLINNGSFQQPDQLQEKGFVKEYYTDIRDQFDVDDAIFKEAAKSATSKEELVGMVNEKFHFVISRL